MSTDIISGDSSNFETSMGGWGCYDRGTGTTQGNCHLHTNYNGRSSVAHIHGGCTGSQGGITQTFATLSGVTYKLNFLAFAGTWDGVDTDVVEVLVSNSDSSSWSQYSVTASAWNSIDHSFTASGSVTITIWSDINQCIDVDDITLSQCSPGIKVLHLLKVIQVFISRMKTENTDYLKKCFKVRVRFNGGGGIIYCEPKFVFFVLKCLMNFRR